jgi:phasin family protein
MIRNIEEVQTFGKESFEAALASATALGNGFQAVASEVADYSRKSFEQGAQAWEKVVAAKSIDKAIEIQQGYAKAAYEAHVSQLNKLGEIWVSTAKAAYRPFEARIAQVANAVKVAK